MSIRQPTDNSFLEQANQILVHPMRVADTQENYRPQKPIVSFHPVSDFLGWDGAPEWILGLIRLNGSKDVLEVGSGANPTLPSDTVSALNIRYTANDVSSRELDKADRIFRRWVWDLSKEAVPADMQNKFDLVFSRMVNEHVKDGRAYHQNVLSLLKPGGIAAHCFSTLYSFPFVANRLLPDSLSSTLLRMFRPRDTHKLGKFRAYYSWSRGPSEAMILRFQSLGYDVLEYRGYFGHTYYSRLPLLQSLEHWKASVLVANPIPVLCSYSMLILRKGL